MLSITLIVQLFLFASSIECTLSKTTSSSSISFIPLNGTCTGNQPAPNRCSPNAFCNPASKCQCQLEYSPMENGIDCQQFTCTTQTQCNSTFGYGTKCYEEKCQCDDSFVLDTRSQTCFPTKQPIGTQCSWNMNCGVNTVCGNHKCVCKYGYTESQFNQINCQYYKCSSDFDCQTQFGAHSECDIATICSCNATSGWNLDQLSQTCVPMHHKLNQTCNSLYECGSYTACGDHRCRCMMGYTPDVSGEINCNPFQCQQNADCMRFDPHAKCQYNLCSCDDTMGWVVAANNQTCIPRKQWIGGSCLTKSDCGFLADCLNERCQCDFGDVPAANQMDCQLLSCSTDSDCSALDENSECNGGICICATGYIISLDTQKCYKLDTLANWLTVVWAVFIVTAVLTVGVMLLVVLVRRSRQSGYIQKF